jgi:hypothetical protein
MSGFPPTGRKHLIHSQKSSSLTLLLLLNPAVLIIVALLGLSFSK